MFAPSSLRLEIIQGGLSKTGQPSIIISSTLGADSPTGRTMLGYCVLGTETAAKLIENAATLTAQAAELQKQIAQLERANKKG
jgi:hypothetical protein